MLSFNLGQPVGGEVYSVTYRYSLQADQAASEVFFNLLVQGGPIKTTSLYIFACNKWMNPQNFMIFGTW